MRHARPRLREQRDLTGVQFHTMRVPHVRANPPQFLRILTGTTAEFLQAIGDILLVLCQMGVQHHALVARQDRSIAHQFTTDRKRRTRRNSHPAHRPLRRIVKAVHHPNAVVQYRRLVLDQIIWGQATRADPNAHRAAGWVKPQSKLSSGVDGILQS